MNQEVTIKVKSKNRQSAIKLLDKPKIKETLRKFHQTTDNKIKIHLIRKADFGKYYQEQTLLKNTYIQVLRLSDLKEEIEAFEKNEMIVGKVYGYRILKKDWQRLKDRLGIR